ncbi:MAG: LiaI-LiaF-like domain-containing protein [Candidatus Komeilibacteria bacterium]
MFLPVVIVILGVVLLLNNLGIVSANVWDVVWPILIIAIGIAMMSKRHCGWLRHWQQSDDASDKQ